MKEILILKDLNPAGPMIKGMLKAEDIYINGINSEVKDYLTKYGDLPEIEFRYSFSDDYGIMSIDLKVKSK